MALGVVTKLRTEPEDGRGLTCSGGRRILKAGMDTYLFGLRYTHMPLITMHCGVRDEDRKEHPLASL